MKILAFDTSSTSGSIALVSDGSLVAEWTVGDVGVHARWLLGSVAALLESVGTEIADIDRFALTTGPGSFTGLRIGMSTVKGLAWSLGRPVTGVSTLAALAMNLEYSSLAVCPILDARKKEVYSAVYRFAPGGGGPEALLEDTVCPPAELFGRIAGLDPGPVVFLGHGLRVYGEAVRDNLPSALFAPEPLWHARAVNIARLASAPDAGATDSLNISPIYLRKSEAEIKLGKARGGGPGR